MATSEAAGDDQLELLSLDSVAQLTPKELAKQRAAAGARKTTKATVPLVEVEPVARVVIASPVPHLDQLFDYAVPETMAQAAPGTRVVVPFSGRLLDAFVVERCAASTFSGQLQRIHRLVSPEVVVLPQILTLSRALAERNAGGLYDVLRLAVPARHARAETRSPQPAEAPQPVSVRQNSEFDVHFAWGRYRGGVALCQRLAAGESPRAAWSVLPGSRREVPAQTPTLDDNDSMQPDADAPAHWALSAVIAARSCLSSGRGVLILVPDVKTLALMKLVVHEHFEAHEYATLDAEQGPEARYREFLRVSRGEAQLVIGTRSAIYAPVRDLGLIVVWDDADLNHTERMAPYAHVRDVAAMRARIEKCALVYGAYSRSIEVQNWVSSGWLVNVVADRDEVRRSTPQVSALDSVIRERTTVHTRIPQHAIAVVREALKRGPVLVQVPRGGFVPAVKCSECGDRARCRDCHGPIQQLAHGGFACTWCARPAADFTCSNCEGTSLTAAIIGIERTVREVERMFPAARVKRSDASGAVLGTVSHEPALVVATPGAEPVAAGGYVAALLLDGWSFLARQELGAELDAIRRWLNAAALVRNAAAGGKVIVCADAELRPVQATVRWSPEWFAESELDERKQLQLPPTTRFATITARRDSAQEFLAHVTLPADVVRLGPVEVDARVAGGGEAPKLLQYILRAPAGRSLELAQALRQALRSQSTRHGGLRTTQKRSAFGGSRLAESQFAAPKGAGARPSAASSGEMDLVQLRLDPPSIGL